MRSINRAILCNRLGVSVALFVALCISGTALAKNNEKAASQPISVISHMALPGTPTKEMMLQQENGHEYLYLLRSSGNGFTVVDVTKPEKPSLVKRVTLPEASIQDLDLVGNSMAIVEQSHKNGTMSRSMRQPETIRVLDLSDPANPRPLEPLTA